MISTTILVWAMSYYVFSLCVMLLFRYYHYIMNNDPILKAPIWTYLLKAPIAPVIAVLLAVILINEDSKKFKCDVTKFLDVIVGEE